MKESLLKNALPAGFAAICVIVILVMAGCQAKDYGVYNASLPAEDQCTLIIPSVLTVDQFDSDTSVN
jgi:hypothetical protein